VATVFCKAPRVVSPYSAQYSIDTGIKEAELEAQHSLPSNVTVKI